MIYYTTDSDLADLLISRLNEMLEHPGVQRDLSELFEHRIRASEDTQDHPDIQTLEDSNGFLDVGMLGILNGLIGTIDYGPKKNQGFICAVFDDDNLITSFERNDKC